ncbi:MAG: YceI family protein [Bryobacteraceae bacterium]|jgi:polyisoprenoid-binding protein YceI
MIQHFRSFLHGDAGGLAAGDLPRFPKRRCGSSILFLTACALPLISPVHAQDLSLEMDPAQSKVEFTLGATLHTVHGSFQFKRGAIHFDPASGKASGELLVDARSGASGNDSRDQKMHKEILESQRFPDIVFRPGRVEGKPAPQGISEIQVHGLFTIHGVEHELTAPVEIHVSGSQYDITAHFTVPYQRWGMKNPSTFLLHVEDHVDITLHAVAHAMSPVPSH